MTSMQSGATTLELGDRMVLLTDGMQERNAASLDVAAALAATADLHPREVAHALGAAVLHATDGDLRDDATTSASTGTARAARWPELRAGCRPRRASASA
ncbi:SpoIIE family protein phosphatase [Modestobacter sp. I12A-02662]|uniref:SpoIIE family protein phosphatase n=1 Tax=Modestobacter sp. I12A-02662 TaxID=1730496 RepID=UPI0034E01969